MISKRGQLQISFNMIFSVILIIAFTAVAIYVIVVVLGIGKCANTALFANYLQEEIDRAWNGPESSITQKFSLTPELKEVCFIDFNSGKEGDKASYYEEAERYATGKNMFFMPIKKACNGMEGFNIKHINIEEITSKNNPYCIKNVNGVELKVEKNLREALVCINCGSRESSGGSSVTWKSTKTVSEQEFIAGAEEVAAEEERFRIEVNDEIHYVGIVDVTETTATIEVFSAPQKAVLSIGQTEKFDVTEDNYYDIQITLNSIINEKADITIKKIYERISGVGDVGNGGSVDFCGTSTLASCNSNMDCKSGGCSGQVCEGKNQDLVTTCEYRDCYNNEKYDISCRCVSGKCKWA